MAKDFMGDILGLALLGGAAYIAWEVWSTMQTQSAAATTTTGTTTPTTPAYVYTPPSASSQLQTAAASNSVVQKQGGQADAYQWAAIYNGIAGLPSISSVSINNAFYPSGLPANQTALVNTPGYSSQGLPLISAALFIQGITAAGVTGLSGFGQAPTLISIPVMLSKSKANIQIPPGTTRAQLQARLRNYVR